MSTAPVLLSELLNPLLIQLDRRYVQNSQDAERTARQRFHEDPTHTNLTEWVDAHEHMVKVACTTSNN